MDIDKLCRQCFAPLNQQGDCTVCHGDGGQRPASHLPQQTILNGKYVVGQSLRQDAQGITYLAYDLMLELCVAIKEYFPADMLSRSSDGFVVIPAAEKSGLLEDELTQYLEEARILTEFKSLPNTAGVLDYFRENGTAYCVMHYIRGRSLRELLPQQGLFRYEQAIRVLLPVMDSLSQMHTKDIFHRDICPDNILLTQDGRPVLLNTGAALILQSPASAKKQLIPKPGYAPKELYRQYEAQGAWTDVYGMAATLYNMVTGQRPTEALHRVSLDRLVYPTQMGAAAPALLDVVLKKALSVEAAERYQSLEEFSFALRAVLESGSARTAVPAVQKPEKKSPLVPLVIAGAVMVAAAVVTVLLVFGPKPQDNALPAQVQNAASQDSEETAQRVPFDLEVTLKKTAQYDKDYGECVTVTPRFETADTALLDLLDDKITSRITDQNYAEPMRGVMLQAMDESFVQALCFFDNGGIDGVKNVGVCIDVKNLKRITWKNMFEPDDIDDVEEKLNKDTVDLLNNASAPGYSASGDIFQGDTPFFIDREGITFMLNISALPSSGITQTQLVKFPWDYLGFKLAYSREDMPLSTKLGLSASSWPVLAPYDYSRYIDYIDSLPGETVGGYDVEDGDEEDPGDYSPANEDEAYYQEIDNLIFQGEYRYYSYSELADKSEWELCIIRNGMFALSGKIFTGNVWCIDYFPSRSWYTPVKSNVRDEMNDYQKENVRLITRIEEEYGWR